MSPFMGIGAPERNGGYMRGDVLEISARNTVLEYHMVMHLCSKTRFARFCEFFFRALAATARTVS